MQIFFCSILVHNAEVELQFLKDS